MQKNIYRCTDYILAGAKTNCAAGRLEAQLVWQPFKNIHKQNLPNTQFNK